MVQEKTGGAHLGTLEAARQGQLGSIRHISAQSHREMIRNLGTFLTLALEGLQKFVLLTRSCRVAIVCVLSVVLLPSDVDHWHLVIVLSS
jgi:hypothetical protein